MEDHEEFWVRFWIVFFAGLALLGAIIVAGILLHNRQMINAGFHRETYTNVVGERWAK